MNSSKISKNEGFIPSISRITVRLNDDNEDSFMDRYANAIDWATWFFTTIGLSSVAVLLLGGYVPTSMLASGTAALYALNTIGKKDGVNFLTGMTAEQIQESIEKGLFIMAGSVILVIYLTDK